ncbi:MAG TPA: hypothetical protein VGI82_11205 [Chitinophagaceae bacterium]|jgi:hypothetical protein
MEDKDFENKTPWSLGLIVSSFCYFAFIRMMKLINVSLPPIFLWIGMVSFLAGCCTGLVSLLRKKKNAPGSVKLAKISSRR